MEDTTTTQTYNSSISDSQKKPYHVLKQFWKWFYIESFGNKIEAKKVSIDT